LTIGETRGRRVLIFLAVFICHAGAVWLIILAARHSNAASAPTLESLVLLLLPHEAPVVAKLEKPQILPSRKRSSAPVAATSRPEPSENAAATTPPDEPKIDWDKEAELAAQSALAEAARENGYRNLSALSPEQLAWVRQNQMEAAAPGIAWKYRRVEITEGGFPIIHINDHCVAIPLLLMMVFCKIGHIEANGKLFEHMRDPHDP